MSVSLSINVFREWMRQNQVYLDPRLEIVEIPGGVGVITVDDLSSVGSSVATIPKSAILSLRVCDIYPLVQHLHVLHGHEAQLGLALALHAEMLRGRMSRWWGYLQTLPREILLPVLWANFDDEDIRLARYWASSTQIQHEIDTGVDFETVSRWWEKNVRNLASRSHAMHGYSYMGSTTLQGFCRAYALVSSRAFLVDAYHGLSMVPLADAFNHTTENHVQMQAEFGVCVECGALDECSHDEMDPTDSVRIVNKTIYTNYTCEMELVAAIPGGAEVFNTYGERLRNAQLICRYGFTLDDNEHDLVSWTEAVLTVPDMDATWNCSGKHLRIFQIMRGILPSAPEWDQSRLIYNTQAQHSQLSLNVNSDGLLSHDLWLWAATLVLTQENIETEMEAESVMISMIRICLEIDIGTDDDAEADASYKLVNGFHDSAEASHAYVHKTLNILNSIIEQRLLLIGKDHSADEIGNILDVNIPANQHHTRMVLVEVLAELSMLGACQATLRTFLDSFN